MRVTTMAAVALSIVLAASALARSDEHAEIRPLLAQCFVCHGEKGAKPSPGIPILAGQEFYYLYVQLKDFKSGLRASPVMAPMVSGLDKPQMQALAKYFSEQPWPGNPFRAAPETIAKGEVAIAAGQCVACHLGGFTGNSRVPRLSGQRPDYLRQTMLDFKLKRRRNSPAKGSLLESFSEEDIAAMADYLGGL